MITIGIDPGVTGAIGILKDGNFIAVFDIPTVAKGSGRKEINPYAVRDLIRESVSAYDDVDVSLEKVGAMPGQGVSSMFSLGDSFGVLRAIVACMNLRMNLVSPSVWKRHFNLNKDKEQSRALAVRLFPTAPLNLKKHSDRAEALLIAKHLWDTKYS